MTGKPYPGKSYGRSAGWRNLSQMERDTREERRKLIQKCRRSSETILEGGRKWKLVRLPDGYASDYPTHGEQSDAA